LAAYYPNDLEVEDLLVDSVDALPGTTGDFMEFLTLGKFDSERVTELRYAMAMNADPTIALKAIRGIGRTRPEDGLDALVRALSRQDNALAEVFEAFAAYGEAAVPFSFILEARFAEVQSDLPEPLTNISLQRMQESLERIAALKE
jgi:HEAT repeat protein